MKYVPTEKEIEKMLEDSSPHISQRLDARLANAPWTVRAVARRRVLSAMLAVIAMVAFSVAILPQGRALAQSILQFFIRTESDTFHLPPSTLTFEDTTLFHEECGISIAPRCSVEQIRKKVDFEVKEPGVLPDRLFFIGATGGPDFVELKYGYPDELEGGLSVSIEATGKPSALGTGVVAKSANVEAVQIGDLPGEYYTGALFQDDEGNVTWLPDDPTATLRWEDGGSTYTIFYFYPNQANPLTKEDLIALAESMRTEPAAR